ncbi:hypothetical protein GS399_07525 [Pedobacter sp. HMF7647]|uniref:Lipocalin-like domain-containing protein n=1 Tax=Hufsiella arboris TaxID=2695275 RepID=A0A7K1Y8S1_9SPHI|nr:lipocalin family protein [Hufsiella arboris]MXV50820.1 hypothetical protein [Hufsiella arboris]
MKNIFTTILLVCGFLLTNCKEDAVDPNNPLKGEWKLVASYADPGNGSGKYEPVSEKIYVKFNVDFSISNNDAYTSYKIIDDKNVEITGKDGRTFRYLYTIQKSTLTLNNLACYEGCWQQYVKQ